MANQETQLIQDPKEIELNEFEQIQTILGRTPGWFLRWGIIFMALIFIGLFAIGHFIQYPDQVMAEAIFINENPPVRIVSQRSGKITNLLVKQNQSIQKDSIIAVIENPAHLQDVQILKQWVHQVNHSRVIPAHFPKNLQLGSLQASYANLYGTFQAYHQYERLNDASQQLQRLLKEQTDLQALAQQQIREEIAARQTDSVALLVLNRVKALHQEGVTSSEAFEQQQLDYYKDHQRYEATQLNRKQTQIQLDRIERMILSLRQGRTNLLFDLSNNLLQTTSALVGQIDEWEQQFMIRAPVSGLINLTSLRQEKQYVTEGMELMAIIPEEVPTISAQLYIPTEFAGKVNLGQSVFLRVNGFPYREYGEVVGQLISINKIPEIKNQVSVYQGLVQIPTPVQSTIGRNIPIQSEMSGTGLIMIAPRSFNERILEGITVFRARQKYSKPLKE